MRKYSKFKDFKTLVAKELGIPVDNQLWWGFGLRENQSYRPHELLTEAQDEQYMCELREKWSAGMGRSWPNRLNLYLQVASSSVSSGSTVLALH